MKLTQIMAMVTETSKTTLVLKSLVLLLNGTKVGAEAARGIAQGYRIMEGLLLMFRTG